MFVRLTSEQVLQHPWIVSEAPDTNLSGDYVFHIRRFQYIRRLRRGVRCIMACIRLIEALKEVSKGK